jgi:hypothetical protein
LGIAIIVVETSDFVDVWKKGIKVSEFQGQGPKGNVVGGLRLDL